MRTARLDLAEKAIRCGQDVMAMEYIREAIYAFLYTTTIYDMPTDPRVEELIEEISVKYQNGRSPIYTHDKIRLGYLSNGFDYVQSVVKQYTHIGMMHDKSLFDVTYYTLLSPDWVEKARRNGQTNGARDYDITTKMLNDVGCKVVYCPNGLGINPKYTWVIKKKGSNKIII